MDPSIFFGDYESIVVSDYHSNYFIPDLNVNSFENNGVNYNDGYIYFHNHPESIDLQIEGYTFSNPPNITLYPNVLNNVAYHLSHSSSVVEHFSNVPVLLIADDLGNFYVPSLDINTIDSNGGMIPGKGYYVFIHGDNEVSFDYDFNAPFLAKSNPEHLDELYYFDPVETGISIPIKVNFDVNFELSNYTEFGLFIDNNIAGNFKITNFDHNYESKIWLDNNSYSMQDIFNETLIGSLLSNIKIRAKLKDSDQVVSIDFSLNENTRFPIIEVGKDNGNRDIFENISYNISDAYPNPFNPKTNIDYSIMEDGEVKITIFDVNGNMVLEKPNTFLQAGSYKFTWDAGDMPSGIYFLAININDNILSSKLILMK